MIGRTLTCCLVLAAIGSAQEPEAKQPEYFYGDLIKRLMDSHGLTGRGKRYEAIGQTEIESLTPLLAWLEGRFGRRNTKVPDNAPLRTLDVPLQVVIREDDHIKAFNGVWVHVLLTKTIESAGKAAAFHLTQVQLPYKNGSFSGMPVGDWTMKNLWGGRPALAFTRKNAFVRVRCHKAVEVLKSDKSVRGVADPGVNDMCEALAREIDAQLDRLPGKKLE